MDKDVVSHIEAVRARTRVSSHHAAALSLHFLKTRLDELDGEGSELLGYFPIAVVAHLEVFFKHALRDLLDQGGPCLDRIDRLIKGGRIKLDAKVASALSGRRVTIGELVAQSLGYSDLVRVCSYFDDVLGSRFLSGVREEHTRPDGASFDQTMAELADLYETRHRIAHEVRAIGPFTKEQADRWIEAAWTFMYACASVFERALFPGGMPQTQTEMNAIAEAGAAEALANVSTAVSTLVEAAPDFSDSLEGMHSAWLAWVRTTAELTVAVVGADKASLGPTIRFTQIQRMAEAEAERLGRVLETLGHAAV